MQLAGRFFNASAIYVQIPKSELMLFSAVISFLFNWGLELPKAIADLPVVDYLLYTLEHSSCGHGEYAHYVYL